MPEINAVPDAGRAALSDAIRNAAVRAAAVIRAAQSPDAAVPGLSWTAGETAAHLVNEFVDYTAYAQGRNNPVGGDHPSRRNAEANAAQLRTDLDRDLASLADRLLPAVTGFLAVEPPAQPLVVSNGLALSWWTMGSALLGELVVHGLDIARASGQPWRIDRSDALLVLDGVLTMMPRYLNRKRAANVRASIEIRLRGGPRYLVGIDHGTAVIGRSTAQARPDCWVSADPAAFLEVGFGRTGQWSQIARGRLLAGGRKPWLATAVGTLFTRP